MHNVRVYRVGRILSEVLFVLLFVFVAALSLPRLFGFWFVSIESGSMTPTLPVGSACLVHKVDPFFLKDGDIIQFEIGDEHIMITHRILSVNNDGSFMTKGDANEEVDKNLVQPESVKGRSELCIPYLGYVLTFLQQIASKILMVLLFFGLIFLIYLFDNLIQNEESAGVSGGKLIRRKHTDAEIVDELPHPSDPEPFVVDSEAVEVSDAVVSES